MSHVKDNNSIYSDGSDDDDDMMMIINRLGQNMNLHRLFYYFR